MIINLKKGIKYFEIIFEFLFILFKKNNFLFIGINIIGIFSRIMTVVAFIFSIKMASLIYEEKILTILNSVIIQFAVFHATFNQFCWSFLHLIACLYEPDLYQGPKT